jgi:outer membrane protein assembly factor BamD (BamD/ComL family)
MRVHRHKYVVISFVIALLTAQPLFAQLGFQLDIKKPEPYDNRQLKAEKSQDKKLKATRRFFQNTTTHYNYFFNANSKLNEIIDRAKLTHKDDYAELLPFYNYSLDVTTQDSLELDSVIYKSRSGIVLHDLRNDWADNLYLLWGAAHYLQQEFDSAYQMFQFINYAFAEKEKDGYYKYIGSHMDGNNALSISTKENNSLPKRALSEPPSRNDAFLWQIRTMIRMGAMPEAGSLIATLKGDPFFPERLKGTLEEVQALWYYEQEVWDSAAFHLVNALDEAQNKQERARWEYLAGQLFEKKGQTEEAEKYYTRAIDHTTDPVLDINARLNLIRINKEGGDAYIDNNIAELLKMAKKDRYTEYRDVIYSMAAQMELERGNLDAAHALFLKASKNKTENIQAGNRAFIKLADLSFDRKDYKQAASFYDSVRVQNLPTEEAQRIDDRKRALSAIVRNMEVVERQDSLQRIAQLPEAEREALVKKMVRQLRRQQGLKDEEISGGPKTSSPLPTTAAPDLFSDKQSKGEWYFYNDNLKSSGVASFKQAWGNRPNMDNWRRFSNVTAQMRRGTPDITRGGPATGSLTTDADAGAAPSYESMLKRLPLTPEQLEASNDSIQGALFTLGNLFVNSLEDYPSAIEALEALRTRFPQPDSLEQVLFQLYYSYTKNNNPVKAAEIRKLMQQSAPSSRLTSIVTTGKDPASEKPSEAITQTYEAIYDQFLEGRFEEAILAKKQADSLYQTNYWSPQLLYIEAVYHVRNREDSAAKTVLNTLIRQNGGTPIAAKAENMIQVLSRRSQIESELASLQVERPQEDTFYVEPMPVVPKAERKEALVSAPKDTLVNKPVVRKPAVDSTITKPVVVQANNSTFAFRADAPHAAVVILSKVDVVFGNETRNAFNRYNREKYYNQPLQGTLINLNDDTKLLIINNFVNAQSAIDYVQAAKAVAASQIVPWLKSDKYTFSIISEDNLKIVTESKDFAAYQKFLDQNLPVKF